MNDAQFQFLRALVDTTGPSGYEQQAQRVWIEHVRGAAESVKVDMMGNAIAALNSGGNPKVMMEAHIDEIGFIVKYIGDDGFLYFAPIGGFDPSTLAGNRVSIMGTNGPVLGVIGRKPTHLIDPEERKNAPEIKNMWIDIGATSREEAQSLVGIGDAGGRCAGVERLRGNFLTGNSFDDRVCCYIVAEAFRNLAEGTPQAAVYAVSGVQEEIGLRGARVAAYEVNPQIGIALDVIWTSDHPHTSKTELGEIVAGKGPVLSRGASTNPKVYQRLVKAAEAEGVQYQIEAAPSSTHTDEDVIQMARSGVATGLISVPTRYLHTASEVLNTDDVDGAVRILTRFVRDLDGNLDLTP